MENNFENFKQRRKLEEAYQKANDLLQEQFAVTSLYVPQKDNISEGHIIIIDLMNKISAMLVMFRKNAEQGNNSSFEKNKDSCEKIIEVVNSLFDLAYIKLQKAKNDTIESMNKIAGIENSVSVNNGDMDDVSINGNDKNGNSENGNRVIPFKVKK